MWIVIYFSKRKEDADRVKSLMENAGIIVKVRDVNNFDGDIKAYEVLVTDADVQNAHNIIIDAEV
ncbi:MAG: hypothetical protein J1F64_03920 [Oscillospiraceae bacterium]|nr:hypothetical protein [Oscillospiraceae bacterium]